MATTNDNRIDIIHIILNNGLIYIFKTVVFILILTTVFVSFKDIENLSVKDFIGTLTFVMTTAIDCTILGSNSKVKGKIAGVHLVFVVILYFASLLVFLVFLEKLSITLIWVAVCNLINILCCISPLIELAYKVMSCIQNENKNNY